MTIPDDKLITFLRDLTLSLENKKLCSRQLQRVGEFFMSYQFQEQAMQDKDESSPEPVKFSHAELIKFLSLGWYVYQVILQDGSLPSDDLD